MPLNPPSTSLPPPALPLLPSAQLGTSSSPLYYLKSGQGVFSLLFNSSALYRSGVTFMTVSIVATTSAVPPVTYTESRVVQVANPASGGLQFSFVLSNVAPGNVPVTSLGRLLAADPATGMYSFMNYLTNYVEVQKVNGSATIAKVDFFRDVRGFPSRFLASLANAPFSVGFSVSDVAVNSPVVIRAVITTSDGLTLHGTFVGRVREQNLPPTDILLSANSVAVRGLAPVCGVCAV